MSTPAQSPVRVLLVDDSEVVRRGLRAVLTNHRGASIEVVGEAGTAADALTECARLKPDIVLMDIRLPDMTGLEACREIKSTQPEVRVVMLTAFLTDDFVYDAITSGAQGYLMKEIDPSGLVQAIRSVADGKSILDPDATTRMMRLMRSHTPTAGEEFSILSPQERRVLALVAAGKTNKEIGLEMGLSDNTVKNYLGSVFEKLQIKRRSQAVALYMQSKPPME